MKKISHNKELLLIAITIVAVILLSSCSFKASQNSPIIKKGILNSSSWDFNKDGNIQLDGQWEFYWEKFLNYNDFICQKPDFYSNVPGVWNNYVLKGKNLPGQGYATYRIHVKTGLREATLLALRIYNFSSAYKLYINDRLIAANGNPGKTSIEEIGEYKPQTVIFNAPAGGFDIIIHVSNFEYGRGGLRYSMFLGSQDNIHKLQDQTMGREVFLLGMLVFSCLFYLAGYFMRKELKYYLYSACLCILIALVFDMGKQFILLRLLPPLNLRTVIFIWYSSTIWLLFFLVLFVNELYRSRFSTVLVKTYFAVAVCRQLVCALTPSTFYTSFGHISDGINLITVACAVAIVAIGIKEGMKDGWLNIASMLTILITYINDDLYWTRKINIRYGEAIYIGIFLFLIIQMMIQAKRMKEFYESKVIAELSFLHAQIKPHFLHNSINTFISISRYDIEKARSLLINFSNYLRRSFDFKNSSQFVQLKNEVELVYAYVEIQKARFEEELEVNFDVCDELEVKVPILILQPIVENAIVHGVLPNKGGGTVDISIQRAGKYIDFCVRDNGVGIEDVNKTVFSKHEFGRGVGLSNANQRLKELYGKGLNISSTKGKGTEVAWSIPISDRRKR